MNLSFKTFSFINKPTVFNNFVRYYRILFFGSDKFSFETLKQLHESNEHDVHVVCPPTPNYKVSAPVKEYAIKHKLPLYHPTSLTTLKGWDIPKSPIFDVGIVVSFRYFIPPRIIKQFKECAINVHPSKLPKYRGGAPIHHTLLNGDKETVVSIIELHPKKMDYGRIINQSEIIPIEDEIMFSELYEKLSIIGGKLVLETLRNLEYFKLNAKEQSCNEEEIKFAPNIEKKMGIIHWKNETVIEIFNKWRALSETIKVSTQLIDGTRVIITEMLHPSRYKIPEQLLNSNYNYGTMVYDSKQKLILVKCLNGWVACTKLLRDGRRECTAKAFAEAKPLTLNNYYIAIT